MLISELDYKLPPELIAQKPLAERARSRMLVVDRARNNWEDDNFRNFPARVSANDVLVLNNTRVFPARLMGTREGFTGKVEVFLIRETANKQVWEVLARPGKRLRDNATLIFGNGKLRGKVLEKRTDGKIIIEFDNKAELADILEEIGETPLPPYILRNAKPDEQDRERYQTIFAKKSGAIAAPTAGLHFTPEILDEVRKRGTTIVEITLHVGYGTFEPVRVEDLSEHRVSPEYYEIDREAAEILNNAQAAKKRILAIGTTTTRALESAASDTGKFESGHKLATLTVTPGYGFKAVNALLTNFHLPQSSLLALVSSFASRELILSAYKHAVAQEYRFYSYGDCMLIV